MRSQLGRLGERFAARLADVRLRMCTNVLNQVAGLRERPAARLADVRLLPRMCPHVLGQDAGLDERLAARLADIRLLPRMYDLVETAPRFVISTLNPTLTLTPKP